MSQLAMFVKQRSPLRRQVTERHNILYTFSTLSETDQLQLRKKILDNETALLRLNTDIQTALWASKGDCDEFDREVEKSLEYDEKNSEMLSTLDALLKTPSGSSQAPIQLSNPARSLLKSPQVALPTFHSEEGEDLTKFIVQFECIVNKFKYGDFDKFQLLRQQVKGRALKLIESLDSNKQNYSSAKDLLLRALASQKVRKFDTISRITKMKMGPKDEPFDYICEMQATSENVDALQIDVDDFLEYFYWTGLNSEFQSQLVQLTNETRPSLRQIRDRFFDATERYRLAQKTTESSNPELKTVGNPTQSLALSVKPYIDPNSSEKSGFKPCSICTKVDNKDADHPLYKCNKFPSNEERVEKLKSLNACLKCANFNHETKSCRFQFKKRCKHCSQWHFSFLCMSTESKSEPEKATVSVSTFTFDEEEELECEETNYRDLNSILPTFTCTLNDTLTIRVMKDSGAQLNVIQEELADSLGLEIVCKRPLSVSGVNKDEIYESKLVKMTVKFGDREQEILATTIPSFEINLDLPGLSRIVKSFKNKGYVLCDSLLEESKDSIECVQMILGTSFGFCIPETEVLFGKDERSIFSWTEFGIMLKGDVSQLIKDLDYLPPAHAYSSVAVCSTEEGVNESLAIASSPASELSTPTMPPGVGYEIVGSEGSLVELERTTSPMLRNCNDYLNNNETLQLEFIQYAFKNAKRLKNNVFEFCNFEFHIKQIVNDVGSGKGLGNYHIEILIHPTNLDPHLKYHYLSKTKHIDDSSDFGQNKKLALENKDNPD